MTIELIEINEIQIISGEGTGSGHIETYNGKRTLRAIKMRLARERCGGDRWARAQVYIHDNSDGDRVYTDIESGRLWIA